MLTIPQPRLTPEHVLQRAERDAYVRAALPAVTSFMLQAATGNDAFDKDKLAAMIADVTFEIADAMIARRYRKEEPK